MLFSYTETAVKYTLNGDYQKVGTLVFFKCNFSVFFA
jgi:hypothetical protein